MSQLANQWIDGFRAHSGENGTFTEQDVQDIVSNYDPRVNEAPAVIGHPEHNAPAWGWVKAVRKVGDLLQFQLKDDVDPAFEQMVKERKFPKRSVKLKRTPKGLTLVHVGFLGAKPPAVKGLADVAFAEDKDAIEIEFSEGANVPELNATDRQSIVDSVLAGIRGFWNGKAAPVPETKTFSEDDVKRLVAEAAASATKETEKRIGDLELKFSEREKKVSTSESRQRADAAILKVKAAGAWVPAFEKMGVPLLFAQLAADTVEIEFGEGDGKKKQTPLDIFVSFMEGLGKIVPTKPVYTGQSSPKKATGVGRVNEGGRVTADPNSILFAEKIAEYREAHADATYEAAMTAVARKHPELTKPSDAFAGAV